MSRRRKKAKCPSCGGLFLKGKYVLRITTDGVVRQRVCQGCAAFAALVLATDAPAVCQNGKCKRLAMYCAGCIAKVIDDKTNVNVAFELAKRRRTRDT